MLRSQRDRGSRDNRLCMLITLASFQANCYMYSVHMHNEMTANFVVIVVGQSIFVNLFWNAVIKNLFFLEFYKLVVFQLLLTNVG